MTFFGASQINAGRDVARSSHVFADSSGLCSGTAPAPTRFARKQDMKSSRPDSSSVKDRNSNLLPGPQSVPCSESAPAPTHFVRKQNTNCSKPSAFLSMSSEASYQQGIESVGVATWELSSSTNAGYDVSNFYAAHRQYVAELLVSTGSSLDECLNVEMWNKRLKAVEAD